MSSKTVLNTKTQSVTFRMLVKDVQIRTLATGDKSCRIVLESLEPSSISDLSKLGTKIETDVTFEDPKRRGSFLDTEYVE